MGKLREAVSVLPESPNGPLDEHVLHCVTALSGVDQHVLRCVPGDHLRRVLPDNLTASGDPVDRPSEFAGRRSNRRWTSRLLCHSGFAPPALLYLPHRSHGAPRGPSPVCSPMGPEPPRPSVTGAAWRTLRGRLRARVWGVNNHPLFPANVTSSDEPTDPAPSPCRTGPSLRA